MTSFNYSIDRTVLNPYNLGFKQNWRQVFGSHLLIGLDRYIPLLVWDNIP